MCVQLLPEGYVTMWSGANLEFVLTAIVIRHSGAKCMASFFSLKSTTYILDHGYIQCKERVSVLCGVAPTWNLF